MFMVSEEVDQLDANATPERVAELTGEIQQRMAATREARNRLFDSVADAADDPLLQNIQEHLNCERYFRRLLNTLEDKTH
jgi:GTP cyclohydrolase I